VKYNYEKISKSIALYEVKKEIMESCYPQTLNQIAAKHGMVDSYLTYIRNKNRTLIAKEKKKIKDRIDVDKFTEKFKYLTSL
jgi:hypothetical protein